MGTGTAMESAEAVDITELYAAHRLSPQPVCQACGLIKGVGHISYDARKRVVIDPDPRPAEALTGGCCSAECRDYHDGAFG